MAESSRIPPAVNQVFIRVASQVCDRAKMDYEEWMVNSQELAYHLQQRWRELTEQGLSTNDAQAKALQMFGDPHTVAKYLRKPWLERLLHYKRFRSERFFFFILAYFLYTWVVICDTHWKELLQGNPATPFQILLPFDQGFFINGLGSMLIGLLAASCVVLSQWRPLFKNQQINRLLLIRYLPLFLTGFALFDVLIRSPITAFQTLREVMSNYSPFTALTIPFLILHVLGISVGILGATCLLFEIMQQGWNNLRIHVILAGVLVSGWISYVLAAKPPSINQPNPPVVSSNLDFNTIDSTKNGQVVRAWLDLKHWASFEPQPQLVRQTQSGGTIYQTLHGPTDSYELVYSFVDGIWKFDDMHWHSLQGVSFELQVSLIIRERRKAQGFMMMRNPALNETQKDFVRMIFNSKPFHP